MSTTVIAGLSLTILGYTGRYLIRYGSTIRTSFARITNNIAQRLPDQYYRGGFEKQINRREAALILGISPTANKTQIRNAYKRLMILNHPDRGGSIYIATKINQAKEILDKSA